MVDKKSPDELLEEVEVHQVERQALDRVFRTFLKTSDNPSLDKFGHTEVSKILNHLGVPQSKADVELIIWEVDEDLDGAISKTEFEVMYKRVVSDKTGLEPRKLFNLVQFMMYDKTNRGLITVEDTLQLLFVRYGREHLDNEIRALFGEEEKRSDGQEKEITFAEYLEQMNKKAMARRKKGKKGRK